MTLVILEESSISWSCTAISSFRLFCGLVRVPNCTTSCNRPLPMTLREKRLSANDSGSWMVSTNRGKYCLNALASGESSWLSMSPTSAISAESGSCEYYYWMDSPQRSLIHSAPPRCITLRHLHAHRLCIGCKHIIYTASHSHPDDLKPM